MKELESIISAYKEAKDNHIDCILATVVHVEGSSYRKAGARMLVDEYGKMTGAISGGCLEGDALRKALHALHQGQNKLITYDTSDEEDAVIGAQLGCNGVIQVLFEPIEADDDSNPIELLKKVTDADHPMVVVSLFNLDKTKHQEGTVAVFDHQLNAYGKVDDLTVRDQVLRDCSKVIKQQHPHFGEYQIDNQKQHAFLNLQSPPPTLVLVGAGNDAQILAQMADNLGWNVMVTDGRPTHANSARFLSSCQVIVTKPEKLLDEVKISENTVFVLISHNYQYDLAVLKVLYNKQKIPYIGILGPKKKYLRMLNDMNMEGIYLTEKQSERVYAPIGLNLRAESPAEIALSILSEIQKVLTDSDGQSLREKKGPIHEKKYNEFKVTTL